MRLKLSLLHGLLQMLNQRAAEQYQYRLMMERSRVLILEKQADSEELRKEQNSAFAARTSMEDRCVMPMRVATSWGPGSQRVTEAEI